MANKLWFHLLWSKDTFPACIIFLQVVLSMLQSGLKVSVLQKWRFLDLQPCSPVLRGALVMVYFETTIPNLAKSSLVYWTLFWGHISQSLKSFLYCLCQTCSVLCGSLWISWWYFSLQFLTFGNTVITLYILLLCERPFFFLKFKLISFVFGIMWSDGLNPN